MSCTRFIFIALCSLFVSLPVHAQSFVVVVGARSPLKHLSPHDISNIFLGRIESIPGAGTARPVELRDDPELRVAFHAAITGMSEHKLRSHWAAMVFTGKARPPWRYESLELLRARLQEDPHALAYLRRQDFDASMRQVFP